MTLLRLPRHPVRGAHARVRAALDERARRRVERSLAGPRLIRSFADCHPRTFFVEIGSNDGEQHDHLRPYILSRDWSGIMVEPVPYVFERLRRNYEDVEGVILENAAVGPRDGELPFYYLVDATDEERRQLPDWYDGIGSFLKEAVLSHVTHIPDVERRIVSARVPTLRFDSLCRKHGVERVDLLLVDAEGYDAEIIRSIDFQGWRPELVVYEHFHLDPEDRVEAAAGLRAAGYETMEEGFDTFCLDVNADERLRQVWRSLRPLKGLSIHDDA